MTGCRRPPVTRVLLSITSLAAIPLACARHGGPTPTPPSQPPRTLLENLAHYGAIATDGGPIREGAEISVGGYARNLAEGPAVTRSDLAVFCAGRPPWNDAELGEWAL